MEKRLFSREFRLNLRKVRYCVLGNVNKTFYCHLKTSFRPFKTLSFLRFAKLNTDAIFTLVLECVSILYVYTFYAYTNISCAFILFITVHQPTASTFPSPSYQIFSFTALRGEILLM